MLQAPAGTAAVALQVMENRVQLGKAPRRWGLGAQLPAGPWVFFPNLGVPRWQGLFDAERERLPGCRGEELSGVLCPLLIPSP